MPGNTLSKPVQCSGAGLHIICYPSSDVYTLIKWQIKHTILIISEV